MKLTCPRCKGTGREKLTYAECPVCLGHMYVMHMRESIAKKMWPEKHFSYLTDKGYEATNLVDKVHKLRIVVFKDHS